MEVSGSRGLILEQKSGSCFSSVSVGIYIVSGEAIDGAGYDTIKRYAISCE